MASDVRFFELNTGAKIPSIGVGTYATSAHIVAAAVKLGYRHIDCAHIYRNEKQIHWPVKVKKGSAGTTPEDFLPPDIPSTWKAMEALYDSGRVRAIGVSNFSTKKLNDLLEVACIPPAVNQVECHPMWQQPKLHEFCRLKGIHLSGYSPLGSQSPEAKNGLLADPVLNMIAEKIGKTLHK